MEKRHKHYQAIRAFADGWEIIEKGLRGWYTRPNPRFHRDIECRIIPDAEGWLPWYGGECPVDGDVMVEHVMSGDVGVTFTEPASKLRWSHTHSSGDIIKYRITKPEKKKVKMWQWVIKYSTQSAPVLTKYFYANEHLMQQGHAQDVHVIQRADWTRIEVEVGE